jgi:hypothetical protein
MSDTAKTKRGGRAFHSRLEPHFDFICQQRQRRKSWQEIADLLFSEKGIRVTLHAPYLFYRRKIKRAAKPQWENPIAVSTPCAADQPEPMRPAPLPVQPTFKRPTRFNLEPDQFT